MIPSRDWGTAAAAAALLVIGSHLSVAAEAAEGQAAHIVAMTREAMDKEGLKAAIVRVTVDSRTIVTAAFGEPLSGVPATPDMHFRNGSVAFSYIATILFQLSDEKQLGLDDKISKWLPDLPHADEITPRMLLTMTSGYADYVIDDQFTAENYADPFRQWTPQELINVGVSKPLLFKPGANWAYSHTGYVILGELIEKITGKPLAEVMKERIFVPLGLRDTKAPATAEIQEPVLHSYSSERREALHIPQSVRFYEESTYWNPSWATAPGAVQTTNIYDLITTAVAIGTGSLISPESYQAMVGPSLVGFGKTTPECPTCHALDMAHHYGPGVFLNGSWIFQSPLYAGYAATEGYLPSKKIAIAVAVTYAEAGFDKDGNYRGNASTDLFNKIGAYLSPHDPP